MTSVILGKSSYSGEMIQFKSQVIFIKQRRKHKKKASPQSCYLTLTSTKCALLKITVEEETVLMFHRNMIRNVRYTQSTNDSSFLCKMEITVEVGKKHHILEIEFTTEDAINVRKSFILEFENDIQKYNKPQNTTMIDADVDMHDLDHKQQKNESNTNITKNEEKSKEMKELVTDELMRKRAKKLMTHKYMYNLYKQLVGKQILSSQEFWIEYGSDSESISSSVSKMNVAMDNSVMHSTVSRASWSLFELLQNDHQIEKKGNIISVELTSDKILEIFIHLPEIRMAYEANVPMKYSEKQFWYAFLQSNYFKKRTSTTIANHNLKETPMDRIFHNFKQKIDNEHGNIHSQESNESEDIDIGIIANAKNTFAEQLSTLTQKKNVEVGIESQNVQQIQMHLNAKNSSKTHRKRMIIDPSIDLALTQESFGVGIISSEDPGHINEHVNKGDIQLWFKEVNQHATMLLCQNGLRNPSNVPVISSDIHSKNQNSKNETLDDMNEYFDRIAVENEFSDLMEDNGKTMIELKINDQSIYWRQNSLLDEQRKQYLMDVSRKLYLLMMNDRNLLSNINPFNTELLNEEQIINILEYNSHMNRNSYETEAYETEQKHNQNQNSRDESQVMYIYMQNDKENENIPNQKINTSVMKTIEIFMQPMQEFIRHYWSCFPADMNRMMKAQKLVLHLKEYEKQLAKAELTFVSKSKTKYQKLLLVPLYDMLTRVFNHFETKCLPYLKGVSL